MTSMPQQSLDFLKSSAPFDILDLDDITRLVKHITVAYVSEENAAQIVSQKKRSLFLISSGQFSVKDSNNAEGHLSEGDFFGVDNLLNHLDQTIQVKVDRAGLIYCIDAAAINSLIEEHPKIAQFFQTYHSEQLHQDAVTDSKSMWLYKPIEEVLSGQPISVDLGTPILQGVQLMSQHSISSLLVTQQDKLVGILTDRDVRNRVVTEQVDVHSPIETIMTSDPAKISQNKTLFDALCVMTEHNIHHLPVVDHITETPVGMLTASDMIRHQRGNVLFIINELSKAQSLYDLTRLSWQLPHYFAKHAKRLGDFDIAGKVLSQATDIMTRKLILFYQQQHGSPPFDYCWLVYGSQARDDQTMGSDQDNAMLLARSPDAQEAEYFSSLADYVCKGLGKCGIKLCDGNIMASNPDLRMSVQEAIQETQKWVRQPTTEAILHFNIFLDVRAVAGNKALLDNLQKAREPLLKQPIFLAALARHAEENSVPLSMFQQFVYKKGHSRDDCIDIKTNAVAIINNLVRIYALASGLKMPSTLARLENLQDSSQLTQSDGNNLRDIWLFLNRLRWRHQLQNNATDNYVCVSDLSSIEKHQLKAAFKSIKRAQQAVLVKFSAGMG
ncbi:putative nucleotidyltransferase substrate binding domain-containing protein [Aliiglaciecola sp. LCG003]|uniref:putative nucleotidyltransferase substrate binding domain-containing protein n=1 Tax=Aliiglaciecola sp. LCG003 TaxID=3053655 RepID=UPI002573B41E|nr:putative nucleotidyltransferase substrate binding domain-containing protein [Aliiglaciecola sp. LCG003]WJG08824.1 putative nucleotidyltransferase substrate binding domain-containing protein [Aliiglaciecola sp. LCG003]